jgi:hypothetical protein
MSSFGDIVAAVAERHEIEGEFGDLKATSFLARTHTGSEYSAGLTAAPVRSFRHDDDTYVVREARQVTINGVSYPGVTAIGYCVASGTLLALDASDVWVRRSSTIALVTLL